MTDDQCTYSLGCYGTPSAQTPNLDQLAREGVVFDKYYVTTAICMASRASVLTGMVEYRTGCNFDHGPLLREIWSQSYPVQLKKAGYFTAFAGKFGVEVAEYPKGPQSMPRGDFDRWAGRPGQAEYETAKNPALAKYVDEFPHSTLAYGAFGRDFIREAVAKDRPFCLTINFKAPHRPATPDPRFNSIYAGKSITKPANFGRENGAHFSEQSRQGRQYRRFTAWHYSNDYDRVMATYFQQVYAVDVAVGMIRSALSEQGVADNTVIIFTSDNGFMCGAHGYGSKVLPYEEASRVPLIILDPHSEAKNRGRRCAALCGNIDIAPTIMRYADVATSNRLDGASLTTLLDDSTASIHGSLPLINVWGPSAVHSLAITTKDWKYIYWPYSKNGFIPQEELYDLSSDPLELANCATNPACAESLRHMQGLYDEQLNRWRKLAVDYHGYKQDGMLFARRHPNPLRGSHQLGDDAGQESIKSAGVGVAGE